ncbi:MAG: SufE family protein [Halothiobacillaceae bacterium]
MTASTPPEVRASIDELATEFAFFSDWTERYQYLIEMGDHMPPYPAEKQDEAHRFHGCQSQVWLDEQLRDGRLHLQGTSDSKIVKGLIALLMRVYSGRTPQQILATDPDFLRELGLAEHLSPNRSTGLFNMVEFIRRRAAELAA